MANSINIVHEMVNKVGWDVEEIDVKRIVSLAEQAGDLMSKGLVKEAGVAFDELGDMFNKKLKEMGRESIDFTDLIKMPDVSTLEKMTSGFASAIAKNVTSGIEAGLKNTANQTKKFMKDSAALRDAYEKRLQNASGAKTGKHVRAGFVNKAKGAFEYEAADTAIGVGRNLKAIANEYNKAANWEDQYVALLKYIKAYEALEKISHDPKTLEKWGSIGEYTIQDLKDARPEIEHTLQNIFNVAYGKAAVGLTNTGEIDVDVKLTPIKMIDVYDVVGKSGKIEVEVVPVVKKAPKNASPNMLRGVHKPENNEGRRQSRDTLGASYWADPVSAKFIARAYGEESLDGGDTIKAHANPLNPLRVNAQVSDEHGKPIVLNFKEIDQIALLKYLFPGVEKFHTLANPNGEDRNQKFYNEMARQAGFDLLEIDNVDEGKGNEEDLDKIESLQTYLSELKQIEEQEKKNIQLTEQEINRRQEIVSFIKELNLQLQYDGYEEYSTASFGSSKEISKDITLAEHVLNNREKKYDSQNVNEKMPLQERIVEYIGKIPDYLDVPQFTPDMERVILSQQKGTAERFYDTKIAELEQMLKESVDAAESGNYRDKHLISDTDDVRKMALQLPAVIEQVKQMRDVALVNFDAEIEKYGGYIEEEVQRGLPKVVEENEYGELVGKITDGTLRERLEEIKELSDSVESAKTKDSKKQLQKDLGAITTVLLKGISEDIEEDAYDVIDALKSGEMSIDDAVRFFAPHLAYDMDAFSTIGKATGNVNVSDAIEDTPSEKELLTQSDDLEELSTQEVEDGIERATVRMRTYDEEIRRAHEHMIRLAKEGMSIYDESYDPFDDTLANKDFFKDFGDQDGHIDQDELFSTLSQKYGQVEYMDENREHVRLKQSEEMVDQIEKAYKRLEEIDNPYEIKDEETLNRLYQERLDIIDRIGAANLKNYNRFKFDDVEKVNSYYRELLEDTKSQKDARRKELTEKLDLYSDDDESYSLEESEAQKAALQEILNSLKQEELLTDELQAKYDAINTKIDDRIVLLKEIQQAYDILDESGKNDYNPYDLDSVQHALVKNKELLDSIPKGALDDDDIAIGVDYIQKENVELEKRLNLLRKVKQGFVDIDSVDDIMFESGDLDSKLSRLGDIANAWGSDVTDTEADEDDDAIDALKEFEETYDRIVLKLANGRKIEILPNAKGLRALHKYDDGLDSSAYGETEIEDVIFERIQKEATIADDAVDSLNNNIAKTQSLMQNESVAAGAGDASLIELEASRAEADKLRIEKKELQERLQRQAEQALDDDYRNQQARAELYEQLSYAEDERELANQRAEAAETELARIKADSNNKNDYTEALNMLHDELERERALRAANENAWAEDIREKWAAESRATEAEAEVEKLKQELAGVKTKTADNIPTFDTTEEQTQISKIKESVESVTSAVKEKTQEFLNEQAAVKKVAQSETHALGEVEKKVKSIQIALSNVNTLLKNVKSGVDIETGLSNITVNVHHQNGDQQKEIINNTVDNVLATENTLSAIKKAVENIDSKVVKGTKAKAYSAANGTKTGIVRKNAEDYANSQFFPEKLKTQTMYLAKFRAQLMTTGKLTDDIDTKIYELLEGLSKVKNGPDFSKWNQQFLQLKTSVGIGDIFEKAEDKITTASYEELIQFQETRNKLELKYQKAQDGTPLKQFYAEQLTQMDGVIAKQEEILKNEEYEAKLSKMRIEQERKLGEVKANAETKDIKKKLADDKKLAKRQAMAGKAGSAIGRAESVWLEADGLDKSKIPDDFKGRVKRYSDELDNLKLKHHEISISDVVTEQQQKDLIAQTKIVNKLTEEIGDVVSEYQKLSGMNVDEEMSVGTNIGQSSNLSDYETALKQYVKEITHGKGQIKGFNASTKTLTYTVKTGKNEFTEYTAAVRHLDKQLVSVRGTTKRTETFLEATTRKMRELTSYFSGMAVFNFAKQELRRGIQYLREIDLALTELKKVTDETEEVYDKFLRTAAKTGEKLGSTISAVTDATSTFAKLGYTMEQATDMAEAAIVYKNVGDNIASTEDAADSIISTLKGFGMEASETMAIVDRFNEVGNRFAITSVGIGEALRLSASALNEGGNSLDESIGMITAANEVVNDPSSVGTALKTLTLRLRGSKTELEEMGEDVSDMATTTSQLQAKLLALTGGQVDIMLDENTFKNSTQILREMAAAWEDMTDIQRAEWCPYVQKCA